MAGLGAFAGGHTPRILPGTLYGEHDDLRYGRIWIVFGFCFYSSADNTLLDGYILAFGNSSTYSCAG